MIAPRQRTWKADALSPVHQLAKVLALQPDLSLHGFYTPRDPYWRDRAEFERQRIEMMLPENVEDFRWASIVLRIRSHGFLPAHSLGAIDSAYLAVCINDMGDLAFGRNVVVGQGLIIAAAMSLGFQVKRYLNDAHGYVVIHTERPEWLP